MATAQSKEQFFQAWESHRKEMACLVCQIDNNSALFDRAWKWYDEGRDIVQTITDHIYPEGEAHEAE